MDPHDRAEAVYRGIQTLDDAPAVVEQAKVEAAWRAEIRRRIDQIENGEVELLDVEESHAALRAELIARRK